MISNLDYATTLPGDVLPEHVNPSERQFQQAKVTLQQQIVESLDLSEIGRVDRGQLQAHVRTLAGELCRSKKGSAAELDQERLTMEVMDEVYGLGPLEKLMRDPTVSDVLVNGPYMVFVERRGRLELTDVIFADTDHLVRIIKRIVARLGRRIDEVSPMVDARLPDGSRVNAVIPPLSIDGPALSIRRFSVERLQIDGLLENGTIVAEIAQFLAAVVEAKIGFAVSGGSGAGKTTLLNALSAYVPAEERIVTIEDSAELKFRRKHLVRMETRPANTEGAGEVTQRDLVRNSLRMRPDRIIIGEVRGSEVWDMLQAMNTGHEGSMTTIHANSAHDALARLEMMVQMTGFELPVPVIRQYIAAGLKLIVHVARLKGGVRRVMGVSEIVGVKDGAYRIEDIFGYEQLDVSEEGTARGRFYATGYRPTCLGRLQTAGIRLPEDLFRQRQLAEG